MKKAYFLFALAGAFVFFSSICSGQIGVISTYVNTYGGNGMTIDSAGNIYVASGHIYKIDPAGVITSLAGTNIAGYSGDGGLAVNAKVDDPFDVVLDHSGNIYFSDEFNNRIRKISTSGIITTVAGGGSMVPSNGVLATSVELGYLAGMAIDNTGNIYITDDVLSVVYKVDTSGNIYIVAGIISGSGFSGDGGPAVSAQIGYPEYVTVDAQRNIFIVSAYTNTIRRVDSNGIITTIAGNGIDGYTGDGGPADSAAIGRVCFMKTDAAGNLFFTNPDNYVVRKIATSGIISTVAGNGIDGYSGDGGPATLATFDGARGIAIDANNNLFINDCYYSFNVVRKVSYTPNVIADSFSIFFLKECEEVNLTALTSSSASALITRFGDGTYDTSTFTETGGQKYTEVSHNYSPGSYTIKQLLLDGTTIIDSAQITTVVNAPPSAISGALSVCAGLTLNLSDVTCCGTWTTTSLIASVNPVTGIVAGISAGSAIITYNTSGGCMKTATVTVVLSPANITGNDEVCTGLTTSLSDATSSGTWASSTTTKATISSSGLVTGVAAGTTTISYSLGSCRAIAVITVNTEPVAIAGTASVCAGLTTTLTDATTGGAWSSNNANANVGTGTGVVTGVIAGTDIITYKFTSGCYKIDVVTVNQSPAAITVGSGTICAGATTSFSDGISGGVWASSATTKATISTSGLVTGIAAGTSSISYTLGSCRETTVITVNTEPVAIAGTGSVCMGLTTTLTDATTGGTWISNNANASVGTGAGVIMGVTAGTDIITYKFATGCYKTDIVTVNQSPAIITGGAGAICAGATTSLADGVSAGVWASSATAVATIATTGIVTGVAAGTANISYTLGSCRATTAITVDAVPAAINGTGSVCSGSTTTLTEATTGGTWSASNANASVGTGAGAVAGVTTGTVVITYKLVTGCYKTDIVTVNQSPAVITVGASAICVGAATNFSDGISGGVWASSAATKATVGTSGLVTGVAAGTATISYTLGACRATTAITVDAVPAAISGTGSVCSGSTTTLTDATTGGIWSASNANASVGTGAGAVAGGTTGTVVITYELVTGCYKTDVVTVNKSPAVITGGSGAICAGATTSLADDIAGGVWASSATGVATIATTGTVAGVAAGTANISYTIGSCRSTTTITVDALPATISGASSVCAGLVTTLSDAITGGSWSSSFPGLASVSSSSGIITGTAAGSATIIYTLPSGCNKTHTITINPDPMGILGVAEVCKGATVNLSDATTGGTSWTSSNTSVATVNNGGVVTGVAVAGGATNITYTVSTGCYTVITLTENPLPNATIYGPATVPLSGGEITLTDATTGGIWTSSHTAVATIGTSSGIVAAVVPSGSTTISYTVSSNGCSATGTHTLTASAAPPPHGGSTDASPSTGLRMTGQVSVYPNPTMGSLTIKAEVAGIFCVYTMDGRAIGEYKVTDGETQINLPNGLATGIYVGRYKGEDGNVQDVKLVYQP